MVCQPEELALILDRLALHSGPPEPMPAKSTLEWLLWESAVSSAWEKQRLAVFTELRDLAGPDGRGILGRSRERLLVLATRGGEDGGQRVERWIEIADKVRFEFAGNLESVLELPYQQARRALARFPGVGTQLAEKILMFTGRAALPVFDSHGLRVLVRLGHVDPCASRAATYRAAQQASERYLAEPSEWFARAYLLLRRHGETLCRRHAPECDACPLRECCPAAP